MIKISRLCRTVGDCRGWSRQRLYADPRRCLFSRRRGSRKGRQGSGVEGRHAATHRPRLGDPKNLVYFLQENREASGHFIFYEIFANKADFEAHNAMPYVIGETISFPLEGGKVAKAKITDPVFYDKEGSRQNV